MSAADGGERDRRDFRILPYAQEAPARNLAVDEALLRGGAEALRFYGWTPPGLSLGYFQVLEPAWAQEARARGFDLVRRPTGGGAIAHVDELTFALVDEVGRGVFGRDARADVERLHRTFVRSLAELGVRAQLRGEASAVSDRSGRSWLCFLKSSDLDLMAEGRKLLGSAARRVRGRVLLHGSLPLRPNPWTPEAISLEECGASCVDPLAVAACLTRGIAREYGLRGLERGLTDEEARAADDLARERYGAAAWTARRGVLPPSANLDPRPAPEAGPPAPAPRPAP